MNEPSATSPADGEPCEAGRTITRKTPPSDGFWSTPCPNEGTDELDVGTPNGSIKLYLCRAHMLALDEQGILD